MCRLSFRVVGVGLALAALVFAASCQKVAEPAPSLTNEQWQRIQRHVVEAPPEDDPNYREVGAVLGGKVELVGYTLEPDPVETGQDIHITWYWKVLDTFEDHWEIFVHLDHGANRQNLDHEAVGGLYSTQNWRVGHIIQDIQSAELEHRMGTGQIDIYIGLWRPADEARMEVSDPGTGTVQPDGRLLVGSFQSRLHVVRYDAPMVSGAIEVDGELEEADWRAAPQTRVWVHPNTGDAVEGLRTQGRVLWDEEALYVGLTAQDTDVWSTITEHDGHLWEEEVLELYLDPLGDGRDYVEIQINPLGTVFDALFPNPRDRNLDEAIQYDVEGMEAAVQVSGTLSDDGIAHRDDRDRRWTAEFRIPWRSLPDIDEAAEVGWTLRANFYRFDRPGDGGQLSSAWSPVGGGTFHQPDKFGEIRLVEGRRARRTPPRREPTPVHEQTQEETEPEGTGHGVRRIDPRMIRPRQPVLPPNRIRVPGTQPNP